MSEDFPRYKRRQNQPKPEKAPSDKLVVRDDKWTMNVNMTLVDKQRVEAIAKRLRLTTTGFIRAGVLDFTNRQERKLKRMEKNNEAK